MGLDAGGGSLLSARALEVAARLLQQKGNLANVLHTRQQILHGGRHAVPQGRPGHPSQLLSATSQSESQLDSSAEADMLHVYGALLNVPCVPWLLGDFLHQPVAAAAAAELPALKRLWHGR